MDAGIFTLFGIDIFKMIVSQIYSLDCARLSMTCKSLYRLCNFRTELFKSTKLVKGCTNSHCYKRIYGTGFVSITNRLYCSKQCYLDRISRIAKENSLNDETSSIIKSKTPYIDWDSGRRVF